MATYDRKAAAAYARKYWNLVSSDGYIGLDKTVSGKNYSQAPGWSFKQNIRFDPGGGRARLTRPYETAYSPDFKQTIEWSDLNDCAHFVSCCIGSEATEKGGGLSVARDYPNGPYGTLGAGRLLEHLTSTGIATFVGPHQHNDASKISELSEGDVIAYWQPTEAKAKGHYAHMALYLGGGFIACHTYCRSDDGNCLWDNNWALRGNGKPEWQWSMLKMP